MEYVIVGDSIESPQYKDCLVYVCGTDKAKAESILNRMTSNPDKYDVFNKTRYHNFRVEEVQDSDCWWNSDFD